MLVKQDTLSKKLVNKLKYELIEKLDPNDKLPSERNLVQTYKVSRTTVRNALDELERLGYIYRQRGRGTFVAYKTSSVTNLANTFSFSEYMKKKGVNADTKVLFLKNKRAKEYQAKMLKINIGDPIYELKRIRYAGSEPMMIERTYLNEKIFKDLTREDLENQSLYEVFKDKFHIDIFTADETCTATLTNPDNNKIFDVPIGTPFLKLERITTDINGKIVEFTLSIARADKFTYHIKQFYQKNK